MIIDLKIFLKETNTKKLHSPKKKKKFAISSLQKKLLLTSIVFVLLFSFVQMVKRKRRKIQQNNGMSKKVSFNGKTKEVSKVRKVKPKSEKTIYPVEYKVKKNEKKKITAKKIWRIDKTKEEQLYKKEWRYNNEKNKTASTVWDKWDNRRRRNENTPKNEDNIWKVNIRKAKRIRRAFHKMDKNKDGKISLLEWDKDTAYDFKDIDNNKNQYIEKREIIIFLHKLKKKLEQKYLEKRQTRAMESMESMRKKENPEKAVEYIQAAKRISAFTGAGISVESGIPPFRGENGIWNKYDPRIFDIDFFVQNPKKTWEYIVEIFVSPFKNVKPNDAHFALAKLEENGLLSTVITQNIDNLHQEAGSETVYEFHGNSKNLLCLQCSEISYFTDVDFSYLPPKCKYCKGILKPNFIFFGEGIPQDALQNSMAETIASDVFLVIGTTGEVMPACMIPRLAKENGAKIIEVNTAKTSFTNPVSDVFLRGKATEVMNDLMKRLGL